MSEVIQSQVSSLLADFSDPYLLENLADAGVVKQVSVEGASVRVTIELGYPVAGYKETLAAALREKIEALDGVDSATVEVTSLIQPRAAQKGVKRLKNIKNIIAVASGKGGVGKSTVSVNLALALAQDGATVGILDADIYGPSQPRMLNINEPPPSLDGKSCEPLVGYGVQSMSIGYLIEEDTPMIWRGPMVTQALMQLLTETNWRDLDYLIIDLPPGTGDIQLTLAQKIPVAGSVIVTTPQDIALLDARKALKMFEKVDVPVLGIVENMSSYVCEACGHTAHIFGQGGGEKMAHEYGVNFLGALPLDLRIREDADAGKPTVAADPDGDLARRYKEVARRTAAMLSMRPKDYSGVLPNVVVEGASS
ncbi:MAG: iron-sulfur cluster carrier protein ApbC [Gammaproteobacteria bacterium]|nr:iron-sulfur cluster carrier protein ApbC [Gammaproteobacteria bacterium]